MKGIKNPELNLAVRILAILGFLIIAGLIGGYIFLQVRSPLVLKFSRGVEEVRINVPVDSLPDAFFLQGIQGAENIYLSESSQAFYVTDLDGNIHLCDTLPGAGYAIVRSLKAGQSATGIDKGPDGSLYAAITLEGKDWRKDGASVHRVSLDLDSMVRLTDDYPAMNGIAFDGERNLYFTSSNFRVLHPEGVLYKANLSHDGRLLSPEGVLADHGLYNGLYYDDARGTFIFSNTIGGAYSYLPDEDAWHEVYLKTRFMEACDDLCTDISGNIWMTDPGYSTVKMYNPGTNRLIRFNIDGVGQTSSVRIRTENRKEMLYLTELKRTHQPAGENFDGRGVLIIPAQSLLAHMENYITEKLKTK